MSIFIDTLKFFVEILKYPFYVVGGVVFLFAFAVFIQLVIARLHGQAPDRRLVRRVPRRLFVVKLLWDAPKQFVADLVARPSDFFREQGCIIFCGRQGSGKTISLVHYALKLRRNYPCSKLIDNLFIKGHDAELYHWSQLTDYSNGKQGVIACIDETQNWFSSAQSKDFPPEMLQVVTQNRKNRRVILGTAQNFQMLAKPIRTQATEVRDCITLAGCVTIVLRREPVLDSEGTVVKRKFRGFYWFVHEHHKQRPD